MIDRKKRIVIIDDNKNLTRFLDSILKIRGYKVQSFNTLDPTEKFLKSSKDAIHAILLDYSFGNKRGEKIARQIKEKSPQSIIIMTSGCSFSKSDSVKKLLNEKVIEAFLEKPFSFSDLENILFKR